MKTKNYLLMMAFIVIPQLITAQWNMVRFDEFNYFTKIETMSPDASVSFGILSQNPNSFMMRTNDGGVTWDSLDLIVSGNEYMISCVNFTDTQNGFAGGIRNGTQALIKTDDNGSSWFDVTPNPSIAFQITGISFVDPQNGFAADQTKVYHTSDGGISWVNFTPGMAIKDIGFPSVNVGYSCGRINQDAAVMKTINGGQTWSTVLTAVIPFFTSSSMQKIDVVSQDAVFVSGQYSSRIFKSLNGGATWDTLNVAAVFEIMDFDFITELQGHLVSGMGEIFRSEDGGLSWTLDYSVAGGVYGPSVFLTSIAFSGSTGYVCGSNGLIKKYEASTGLYESAMMGNLSIYPNPVSTSELLNIGEHEGDFVVQLFNASGKLVNQQLNNPELNIQNLSTGVYFVKVITKNYVQIGKVTVVY